ncbi:MAG: hypothetical protein L7S45_02455 [Luminiphilus sp.]|nr:hypothetical protein [Luminiphilus sp.]
MPKYFSGSIFLWVTSFALVLTGCETTSVTEISSPVSEDEVAEVIVAEESSIPSYDVADATMSCACEEDEPQMPERSALDLAFEAIAGNDFDAAQAHFDYHGATAEGQALREAESGLAVIELLQSQSQLIARLNELDMDARMSVLRVLLDTIDQLRREAVALSRENIRLNDELAKREAVLKRLRELALEQLED